MTIEDWMQRCERSEYELAEAEARIADLERVNAILEAHVDEARSEQYAANENAAYLEEALEISLLPPGARKCRRCWRG